ERGLQLGERLERRLAPDALVGREHGAVHTEGQELALEAPLVGRARGALVRAERDLVALAARDAPPLRDQLRAHPLVHDGMAPDVVGLLAVLLDAAGDHVLDRLGRDSAALDQLDPRPAEQLVRVDVPVVALLGMTPADRRPYCLDDDDLASLHAISPRSLWSTR